MSTTKLNNDSRQRKYSRLTLEDRMQIHLNLNNGASANQIASILGKSVSTITREIKNHLGSKRTTKNDCIHRTACNHHNVCKKARPCKYLCSKCKTPCKRYCADYMKMECEHLEHYPYVCNACPKKVYCNFDKRFYDAAEADREAKNSLVNSRNGFNLTAAEIIKIDNLASPMIRNGLSPYHVKQTYGDDLPCSESTLRRLIHECMLGVSDIDLTETVKRKRRKNRRHLHNEAKRIPISKTGHMYADYEKLMETYTGIVVQMDCVEGKQTDRATLLTLHWPLTHMQIAIIMNEHTSVEVVNALDKIEESLGSRELFHKYLPIILTDNGHEFMDIKRMERSIYGGQRTKVYFCEPNRSDQKAQCEVNHKMIRRIIPKGTSLESFMQADISLMMNHINSYKRGELMGRSPYEMSEFMMPDDFHDFCISLGVELIPPTDIILAPKLLQKHSTEVKAIEKDASVGDCVDSDRNEI